MKIKFGRYTITATFEVTIHPDWMLEVIENIKTGQTLTAIKIFKDNTGYGLLDAKNFIVGIRDYFVLTHKIKIPVYKTL